MPDLSTNMLSALGAMPVRLRTYDNGRTYHLPSTLRASGATLKALQRRGLVEYDDCDRAWKRTDLGNQAWEEQ